MPRPQKSRRICCYPDYWSFAPDQDIANDTVTMTLDEFETIRLIDHSGKTQEQCANEMNVARTTVTAIYDSASAFSAAGMALVSKNGLYGYIDAAGKIVIDMNYSYLGPFYSGLAPAKIQPPWAQNSRKVSSASPGAGSNRSASGK